MEFHVYSTRVHEILCQSVNFTNYFLCVSQLGELIQPLQLRLLLQSGLAQCFDYVMRA